MRSHGGRWVLRLAVLAAMAGLLVETIAAGEPRSRPPGPTARPAERGSGNRNGDGGNSGGNAVGNRPPAGGAATGDGQTPRVNAIARQSTLKKTDGTEVTGIVLAQARRGVLLAGEDGQIFVPAAEVVSLTPRPHGDKDKTAPNAARQLKDTEASTLTAFTTELRDGGYRVVGVAPPAGGQTGNTNDNAGGLQPDAMPQLYKEMREVMREMADARKGVWPSDPKRASLLAECMRLFGEEIASPPPAGPPEAGPDNPAPEAKPESEPPAP